jgi:hypothetical protein
MTESAEALGILARIMARAYLNDNQGANATVSRTRKRVKKDESLRRPTRSKSDGKSSHQSQG